MTHSDTASYATMPDILVPISTETPSRVAFRWIRPLGWDFETTIKSVTKGLYCYVSYKFEVAFSALEIQQLSMTTRLVWRKGGEERKLYARGIGIYIFHICGCLATKQQLAEVGKSCSEMIFENQAVENRCNGGKMRRKARHQKQQGKAKVWQGYKGME